jgi:mono/diheme cytochrome c family protein
MKIRRLMVMSTAFAALVGFGNLAHADAAAGKATFEKVCAECHEAGDFKGEDAAEVQATIKSIVAGKTKHKKAITLTDAQVADVAAYMVTY